MESTILMSNDEYITAAEIYEFIENTTNKGLLITAIDCIQIKEDGIYSPIEWIAYIGDNYENEWDYYFKRENGFLSFVNKALEHDPNFYFEVFFETKEEFEAQRTAALAAKEKSLPFYKKIWRAVS